MLGRAHDLHVVAPANADAARRAHALIEVLLHGVEARLDVRAQLTAHVLLHVVADARDGVLFHDVDPRAEDLPPLIPAREEGVVSAHHLVEIALGVEDDLLLGRGVLERELVPPAAARRAGRFEPAPGLVRWEGKRRRVRAVVEGAEYDGLVRIAALEGHDDLRADAGDELRTPAGAGPGLHGPDPARGLVVTAALAVPMELHLDAAHRVDVDLLAGRAHDDGRVRDLNAAPLGPRGHEGDIGRHGGEGVPVDPVLRPCGGARGAVVLDADHRVCPVEVRSRVVGEREAVTGREIGAAALTVGRGGPPPLLT